MQNHCKECWDGVCEAMVTHREEHSMACLCRFMCGHVLSEIRKFLSSRHTHISALQVFRVIPDDLFQGEGLNGGEKPSASSVGSTVSVQCFGVLDAGSITSTWVSQSLIIIAVYSFYKLFV